VPNFMMRPAHTTLHDHQIMATSTRRILGLDPGKTNFGIGIVELPRGSNKPLVIANGILECPLDNIKDRFRDGVSQFLVEVEEWVNEYNPSAIIAERFQSRGLMGTTVEMVGIMLGALCIHFIDMPMRVITAASWKVPLQKQTEKLDGVYKRCMTTPHQIDAVFQGCYGLEKGLNTKIQYDIDDIIRQTEATSQEPLHKRKARK